MGGQSLSQKSWLAPAVVSDKLRSKQHRLLSTFTTANLITTIMTALKGTQSRLTGSYKKTKTRIYVGKEGRSLKSTGHWWDYEQRSFILDRQELETNGSVWSRTERWHYYSTPDVYFAQRRTSQSCSECLIKLGFGASATEEEVKAAFRRLAKKTHPDSGGDPEEFKALMGWYEPALEIVGPDLGAT